MPVYLGALAATISLAVPVPVYAAARYETVRSFSATGPAPMAPSVFDTRFSGILIQSTEDNDDEGIVADAVGSNYLPNDRTMLPVDDQPVPGAPQGTGVMMTNPTPLREPASFFLLLTGFAFIGGAMRLGRFRPVDRDWKPA